MMIGNNRCAIHITAWIWMSFLFKVKLEINTIIRMMDDEFQEDSFPLDQNKKHLNLAILNILKKLLRILIKRVDICLKATGTW